jgi:RNA polymerase sigma factor (sigma-70 family)
VEAIDSSLEHAVLHAAWRAGDRHAAAELIVRYRPRLRAFGRRLDLPAEQAEDFAHEVLLEAHRSKFEARAGATYWAWLAVIGRRTANRMRREWKQELPVRRQTSPWGGACRRQLLELIEEMPEHLHEVFAWLVVGYDSGEIGRKLGIAPGTVRMRIHRGRKWLRARGY